MLIKVQLKATWYGFILRTLDKSMFLMCLTSIILKCSRCPYMSLICVHNCLTIDILGSWLAFEFVNRSKAEITFCPSTVPYFCARASPCWHRKWCVFYGRHLTLYEQLRVYVDEVLIRGATIITHGSQKVLEVYTGCPAGDMAQYRPSWGFRLWRTNLCVQHSPLLQKWVLPLYWCASLSPVHMCVSTRQIVTYYNVFKSFMDMTCLFCFRYRAAAPQV